jgi:hypothetical protein
VANCEAWNGSSWSEINDLSTARTEGGALGTTSGAGLYFGGSTPTRTTATEEFTAADFDITTLTTS